MEKWNINNNNSNNYVTINNICHNYRKQSKISEIGIWNQETVETKHNYCYPTGPFCYGSQP